MTDLITQYEKREDEESRFIYALDKVVAPINIYLDGGKLWKVKGVTFDELLEQKTPKVAEHPEVKKYFDQLVVLLEKEKHEYVDFAVTARKYKTLLTTKYQNRKQWVNPSPYDVQSIIPGTILDVFVKEGEIVQEGAPILTLEAMKMVNRIEMPFTARIKKINVEVGIRIPKDTLMIELEAVDKE